MHKLIIEDDEGKTVVVPLVRDEITIGRQEGNTVRLTDQNISRKHARLFKSNGSLFVEDVGSYNGIRVNGSRIQIKQSLKDGDEVAIGDYKLGIKDDAAKGAPKSNDQTLGYNAQQPFQPAEKDPSAVQSAVVQQRQAATAQAAPAPDEEIDGQPTIPVRTLADQERDSRTVDVPPARLVVVSGPLSGAEFHLDRASLVIGRTPENDIVLNHKSISRHHAKIISDGHDFIVVDLESANGVRVNGSKEDRVQLDHGDTIELGHVRMQFSVGDGEPLMYTTGRSKKPIFIGAAVGVVALVGAVFAMSGDKKTSATANEPPPAPVVTPTPSESPAAPDPQVETGSTAEMVANAKTAADAENYDEALAILRKAAELDPASSDVATLAAQTQANKDAFDALADLKLHAAAGDYQAAQESADAIPTDSQYAADAPALVEQAKQAFINAALHAAAQALTDDDCATAIQQAETVLAHDANQSEAREIVDACAKPAKPVVAARTPPPRPRAAARPAPRPAPRPAAVRAKPKREPPPPAPEPPTGNPDEFIKEAQDAWLRGQYAAAISSSRKALKLRPGMMRAYQIIAVCSCSLRDEPAATRAYGRLDAKNKGLVRSLCQKNGISLN